MTQYWCANFYSEECLQHGITHDFWAMQYQYEDDDGNLFEGGKRKSSTSANWNRLKQIQEGDWLVAYLKKEQSRTGNSFFAVGKVRRPRKPATSDKHISTVAEYVSRKRSHEYDAGVIHYTDAPVFYEDFDDNWRRSNSPLKRHAQRIDVEDWQFLVADGVPWLDGLSVPVNEIKRVFFRIGEDHFNQIVEQLKALSNEERQTWKRWDSAAEIADDSVVEALERSYAKGQGFMLDSKLRAELEEYSMAAATKYFEARGYEVTDHSKNHPYDLKCTCEQSTLYVEVKGTQTDGEEVILTRGEVEFARQHSEQMALFVLHSIQVSSDRRKLSQGEPAVIHPWVVEESALAPLSYKYVVPIE